MKVVITAATTGEWMPSFLDINPLYTEDSQRFKVIFHQTGVGMLATAVSLMKLIYEEKPDLIIQIGIAGCFNSVIPLGKIFVVADETIADIGVSEEGKWKDIFELKLEKSSYPPYDKRRLPNHHLPRLNVLNLPVVSAVSVNEITTQPDRIAQIIKKYNPLLESMEGGALHYVGRLMNTPFIQIRAISNYVGERDKANWKIKEAIENINHTVLLMIDKLYKLK